MENDLFKKVATFQYAAEAAIIKGKLESTGIEVFMHDNFTIDSDPLISNAIGGVKLFVKSADYEKANEILESIPKHSVDEAGKAIQCPKCGNDQIDMLTTINDLKSLLSFVFSLVLVLLPFYAKYKYKCNQCGFEF